MLGFLYLLFFILTAFIIDFIIVYIKSRAWHKGKADTRYRKVKNRL